MHNLPLTDDELDDLYNLLNEEAMRLDDDGREGAFDVSSLRPIYDKIRDIRDKLEQVRNPWHPKHRARNP